jgi:hypothetical protein
MVAGLTGLLLVVGGGGASRGDDDPPSPANLEMVRGVARTALGKLLTNFQAPGRRIEVSIDPAHETGWLVQDLVGEILRSSGYEIVEAAAPASRDTARAATAPGVGVPAPPAPALPDTTVPPPAGGTAGGGGSTGSGGTNPAAAPAGSGETTPAGAPGNTGETPPGTTGGSTSSASDPFVPAAAPGAGGSGANGAPPKAGGAGSIIESARPWLAPAGDVADARLDIRVIELGVRYTKLHRGGFLFFGERTVDRFASARLHGELRRPTDHVVRWSGDADASASDEVQVSRLSTLEGLDYPFTDPQVPPGGAARIIEPIIVSAIVVGLVFLFVSNRS